MFEGASSISGRQTVFDVVVMTSRTLVFGGFLPLRTPAACDIAVCNHANPAVPCSANGQYSSSIPGPCQRWQTESFSSGLEM